MDQDRIQAAADWAVVKLSRAFPGSFPDAGTVGERTKLLVELLTEHPWISAESWKGGVMYVCWHHQGDYLPAPAKLIDACREEGRRLEREKTKALPAPESAEGDGSGYERFLAMAEKLTGRRPNGSRYVDTTRQPDSRWRPQTR